MVDCERCAVNGRLAAPRARLPSEFAEAATPAHFPAKSGAREMSLRQMRGQGMIGGLVEEGGFLGGRFQELLVLVVDVVAELDGLVAF